MSGAKVCDECGKTVQTVYSAVFDWISTHQEFMGGELDHDFCSWECLARFADRGGRNKEAERA